MKGGLKMIFKKKVQFLNFDNGDLKKYSFLDLESNLPFDIYSTTVLDSYKELEPYSVSEQNFNLVRINDSKKGLCWKIKGV